MYGRLKNILLPGILLLSTLLSACGATYRVTSPGIGPVPNENGKPPAVTISVNGREQTSRVSTYCWPQPPKPDEQESSLCIDSIGMATPVEPLGANSPLSIRFGIPMDRPPTSLTLNILPVTDADKANEEPIDGALFWNFRQGGASHTLANTLTPSINLELEPGLYVITLFASWEGVGDAMHGFLIQVT